MAMIDFPRGMPMAWRHGPPGGTGRAFMASIGTGGPYGRSYRSCRSARQQAVLAGYASTWELSTFSKWMISSPLGSNQVMSVPWR